MLVIDVCGIVEYKWYFVGELIVCMLCIVVGCVFGVLVVFEV